MHRVVNGTPKGWLTLMGEMYREIVSPDQILEEEPMYVEDMELGKEYEDAARASAELLIGEDIVQVGFATHHVHDWLGSSVDGLILDEDGKVKKWVEIKVFASLANHAYAWTNKRPIDRYIPQCQTHSLVYGGIPGIFISHHEDMPDPVARTAIVEVQADWQYQQSILGRAIRFNADFEMYKNNGGTLPVLAPTIPKRF